MPVGPGKYDDLCTVAREGAGATGAVLIIINGRHGNGFSCQGNHAITLKLPDLLEDMARQLRHDLELNPPWF